MHVMILTMQLNVYSNEQRINPRISDSYSAIAVNHETLDQVINNITDSTLTVSRKIVLIACPIVITAMILFVSVTVLALYSCGGIRKRWSNGLSNQAKAAIISICFISIGRIVIFIGLDIGAIIVQHKNLDPRIRSIYHRGRAGELSDITYNIPLTLILFDGIALLACGILLIISFAAYSSRKCKIKLWCRYILKDFYYSFLALTVIPLIVSAYSHAPYIIMAYVSDANYASSIFIYYVIAIFVEFGLLEYTFSTYFNKSHRSSTYGLFVLLAIVLSLVVNALMTTVFIFFFFVPIKYALSNAPNEVVVIYQSAVVLVGGYITYKAVFKNENCQQELDCNVWNNDIALSEDEIALLRRTDVEAGAIKEDNQTKIANLRKKITYLRNEMALASLKQKLARLQSMSDYETNLIEVIHLQNEICHLNGEITYYLEDKLQCLEVDSNDQNNQDEVVYLRDKIYHTDLKIIEHLQRRIFYVWLEKPLNRKRIVRLRREMIVSLMRERRLACFVDHPNNVSLSKDVDDMEKDIKAFLIGESSIQEEFDDIEFGEDVAFNNRLINYREERIKTTDVPTVKVELQREIDSFRLKVVGAITNRIAYRKRRLEKLTMELQQNQQEPTATLSIQIDSLRAEIIDEAEEKLKHLKHNLDNNKDTVSSEVKSIKTLTEARIDYAVKVISHIQGGGGQQALSPELLRQIDSMRDRIISLKTRVLQILEGKTIHIEDNNSQQIQEDIRKLKPEIAAYIEKRIGHLEHVQRSQSCSTPERYAIERQIESLKLKKTQMQGSDAAVEVSAGVRAEAATPGTGRYISL